MNRFFLILILLITALTLNAQEGTPDIIRGDESFTVIVRTENYDNSSPVDGVEVYLYETKSGLLVDKASTADGQAVFSIDPMTEYEIISCHKDFLRNGFSIFECNEGNEVFCTLGASFPFFASAGGKNKPQAYFSATLPIKPIDIGSVFELENIYYDLDKSNLREESKKELDDLVDILNRNESITIELSAHTDSRASFSYNENLSQKRAQSCIDYLIKRGISPSRLIAKGYGEENLVNECADGVECTEEQHQKNRRTEFLVLSYEEIECEPAPKMEFKLKDLKNDHDDLASSK